MQCPTCRASLVTVQREDVVMAACPGGHGLWVTFETLQQALDSERVPRSSAERTQVLQIAADPAAAVAPAALDERPALACAQCAAPMQRMLHDYATGVWIDLCALHGIWLDAGELERLEAGAEAARYGAAGHAHVAQPSLPPDPVPHAQSKERWHDHDAGEVDIDLHMLRSMGGFIPTR